MRTLDELRAGRSCKTCVLFDEHPHWDRVKKHGLCRYVPPPTMTRSGRYTRKRDREDWCHAWVPDMARME